MSIKLPEEEIKEIRTLLNVEVDADIVQAVRVIQAQSWRATALVSAARTGLEEVLRMLRKFQS